MKSLWWESSNSIWVSLLVAVGYFFLPSNTFYLSNFLTIYISCYWLYELSVLWGSSVSCIIALFWWLYIEVHQAGMQEISFSMLNENWNKGSLYFPLTRRSISSAIYSIVLLATSVNRISSSIFPKGWIGV